MDPRQIELAKRYREDPEFRAFFAKRWKETFGYDFGSAPGQPTEPERPQNPGPDSDDSDDDDYEPSEDSSEVSSDDDAVEEEQDETGITYKMRDYEDEF